MIKKTANFVLNKLRKKFHTLYRTNEGGSIIRRTRLKKFSKKSKKVIIAAQLVAVWYLLILTGSYLTSDTGAYFSDTAVINNYIHAKWAEQSDPPDNNEWDKSSLSFAGSKAWSEGCKVSSTIQNTGSKDMTFSTWKFYLDKITNGKPIGEPVATGIVPNIKSGKWGEITTTVTEDGVYKFTVRRPLGHPGKNQPDENGYSYVKSDNAITVTGCTKVAAKDGDEAKPNDSQPQPQVNNQPLGEVTDLSWNFKGASGKVTINWKNPSDPNFNYVRVYKEGQDQPFIDSIQDQKLDIDKTDTAGTTIYRITVVDKSDIESPGIKITVSNNNVIVN